MSPAGGSIIRGESWKFAYQPETTYGVDPVSGYINVFGVVQTATMPDPAIDYQPFWGQGTSSARNWYVAYKGRISLTGSIPDVILLDGKPLVYPIGNVVTTSAVTSGYYTHTITEATTLNSIALHLTYVDSAGTVQLMRRYLGGKVGRATIEASEGDFLRMSVDDIQFINLYHSQSGYTYYSSNVAAVTPVYPTTQPYLFSYGSLTLGGTVFARIRNFRLSISNNLEAKYYITGSGVINHLPYEHREGRREYQLTCTIDIENAALFRELVAMGTYTNIYKGFQVSIAFTRGTNDSIIMTMPASTPAAGGDAMGCLVQTAPHNIVQDPVVSVPLTIITRNLQIVVNDTVFSYS